MKTKRKASYKCGYCGYTSPKMIDLHKHLIDHSGIVGYFYDISSETGFPKWELDDSLVKLNVYTPAEEVISISNRSIKNEDNADRPEFEAIDGIVKTELVYVDNDYTNPETDYEVTPQDGISEIGLELYEGNTGFNVTGSPEVKVENTCEKEYPKPFPKSSKTQMQLTKGVYQKRKPKNQNKGKQIKQGQRTHKRCTTEMARSDVESQSATSFQSENANEEDDQFPVEYLTASVNNNEADTNENGNTPQVVNLENLNDSDYYQVELANKNTYVHRCTACSFSCPTKYKLMVHISKYCEKISFICEVCGTVVANKQELSRHKKSCFRMRFKCDICDVTRKSSWALEQHMRLHSGECPYVCDQCAKAFRTQENLTKHMKCLHSSERNYKCDQCEKSFKISAALYKHKRIHNKVLLYSCDFCEKKFSSGWNLKAHIRRHTGTKPYSCSKCGEAFAHNVSRKAHQAKCWFIPGNTSKT